jgi:predicted phage terminase large subunit-like protein
MVATDIHKLARQEYPEIDPRMPVAIPYAPHSKQQMFLLLDCQEAFYGGAARGGKSAALLMAALQYVDVPNYAALILRRTFPQLSMEGGMIPMSREWLGGQARWNAGRYQWTFPSGATITFGHLDTENDVYQYAGSAFQFIGFDELTTFSEWQYRFLFSRLVRTTGTKIPLRMRSTSNPGGQGHGWVRRYFMEEGKFKNRLVIPALLWDNPGVDHEAYEQSLNQLDPITRARLRQGDWWIVDAGAMFSRQWFEIVDQAPADCNWVRAWDLASTQPTKHNDPDWTAGALVGLKDGIWYIADMQRARTTPQGVEALVKQTAELDGRNVAIRMEQEPGASGVAIIDHYARRVLVGWDFQGVRATGKKTGRAAPVSSAAEAGNIRLVRGHWIGDFLDEFDSFPQGEHDDQVDAVSGAVAELGKTGMPRIRWLG